MQLVQGLLVGFPYNYKDVFGSRIRWNGTELFVPSTRSCVWLYRRNETKLFPITKYTSKMWNALVRPNRSNQEQRLAQHHCSERKKHFSHPEFLPLALVSAATHLPLALVSITTLLSLSSPPPVGAIPLVFAASPLLLLFAAALPLCSCSPSRAQLLFLSCASWP